jgi:apolipoprotein N-acyltransferase
MNNGILLAGVVLVVGLAVSISCFCAMAMELDKKQERVVEFFVWVSGLMIGSGIVLLCIVSEG